MKRPSTIWEGNDRDLLDWLLPFSLRKDPNKILDITYGRGRCWSRNGKFEKILIKCDISPRFSDVVQSDFNSIPFRNNSFDAVVVDPPHIAEANISGASHLLSGDAGAGYGSVEDAPNVCGLFPGILKEVKRVLLQDGICLFKICDMVHRGKMHFQHVDLINEALKFNLTPCTMIIKTRKNAVMGGTWINVLHPRQYHSMWIVFRNGKC